MSEQRTPEGAIPEQSQVVANPETPVRSTGLDKVETVAGSPKVDTTSGSDLRDQVKIDGVRAEIGKIGSDSPPTTDDEHQDLLKEHPKLLTEDEARVVSPAGKELIDEALDLQAQAIKKREEREGLPNELGYDSKARDLSDEEGVLSRMAGEKLSTAEQLEYWTLVLERNPDAKVEGWDVPKLMSTEASISKLRLDAQKFRALEQGVWSASRSGEALDHLRKYGNEEVAQITDDAISEGFRKPDTTVREITEAIQRKLFEGSKEKRKLADTHQATIDNFVSTAFPAKQKFEA